MGMFERHPFIQGLNKFFIFMFPWMDPTEFKSSSLPFSVTFTTNITIRHQVARSGLIFCGVGCEGTTLTESRTGVCHS